MQTGECWFVGFFLFFLFWFVVLGFLCWVFFKQQNKAKNPHQNKTRKHPNIHKVEIMLEYIYDFISSVHKKVHRCKKIILSEVSF